MKTLFLIAMFVAGAVSAAPAIDVNCDKVGIFAKGIATVKETGITEFDIDSYISVPKIQPYPITWIRHRIYADNLSGDAAYSRFYTACVLVGFTHLMNYAQEQDHLANLIEENETLKKENTHLLDQVNQITNQYVQSTTRTAAVSK
jgi:hypothetical protein